MLYTHERNYGCRITEYVYRGLRTVVLENELIKVVVLADKGTDILEFVHKPTDTDFMWRSPTGVRDPRTSIPTMPLQNGAFTDYYEGGWQEILPNGGNACIYRGAPLGQHGEVSLVPWDYSVLENSAACVAVRFAVKTYRTPFWLEKTMTLRSWQPVLRIEERLTNEGSEEVDLMWGHHPAFGAPFLDDTCRVDAPALGFKTLDFKYTENHRLAIGQASRWPMANAVDGSVVDISEIPGKAIASHDYGSLCDLREGWYALTNTGRRVGIALSWPLEIFPYLWFWQNYGGAAGYPWYGNAYVVALEPFTSFPPVLTEAIKANTQMRLKPGESARAWLNATAYSELVSVDRVTAEGEVVGSVA